MRSAQLRGWQKEAFARYQEALLAGRRALLWEATPGAGKTTAALQVIRDQIESKRAQKILVVVPTSHLRIQWARAASQIGIQLDSAFGGDRSALTSDYHGAVVTYQQFGNRAVLFHEVASRSVVVLDEVHHAGDGLSWGNALTATLRDARFILCLSGTAFRSDSNAIPFVQYDREGMSTPDFSYPYARAVEEGVCRPTAFFTYGGDVSWSEREKVLSASFSDALEPSVSARRLRAALDADAGWIQPMVRDAHAMLQSIRREHPEAGGLLVCADQTHARQMAKTLLTITGEKPVVVLSDDSGASAKIKSFAESKNCWLVACNMVSEGVDIPRLRLGVYGTTIRTKMYFRQFLGRVVRRQSHLTGAQVAYVYLPADPTLHQLAEEIEVEIRHLLQRQKEGTFTEDFRERANNGVDRERSWAALHAVNSGVDAVIVHGNQLSLFGGGAHPQVVQEAIQREVALRLEEGPARSEIKSRLATDIKALVSRVHKKTQKPHSAIHTLLNKAQGVRSQTHCTEQQLHERIRLLHEMICSSLIGDKRMRA